MESKASATIPVPHELEAKAWDSVVSIEQFLDTVVRPTNNPAMNLLLPGDQQKRSWTADSTSLPTDSTPMTDDPSAVTHAPTPPTPAYSPPVSSNKATGNMPSLNQGRVTFGACPKTVSTNDPNPATKAPARSTLADSNASGPAASKDVEMPSLNQTRDESGGALPAYTAWNTPLPDSVWQDVDKVRENADDLISQMESLDLAGDHPRRHHGTMDHVHTPH